MKKKTKQKPKTKKCASKPTVTDHLKRLETETGQRWFVLKRIAGNREIVLARAAGTGQVTVPANVDYQTVRRLCGFEPPKIDDYAYRSVAGYGEPFRIL